MIRILLSLVCCISIAGCLSSVKDIGKNPSLSSVGSGLTGNEVMVPPTEYAVRRRKSAFSIWDSRQGDLFKDNLAMKPGDILTVQVSINDRAQFSNRSDSKRTVGRGLGLNGSYAVDGLGSDANANANIDSTSDFRGDGGTNRSEDIQLLVAAVVTGVLANGNLIVRGSQEVRVNAEMRVLTIAGIVRPTDIGPNNTISYERIAEARVSYGGRGHISAVQRPPYGQQFINAVSPF